MGTDDFGHRQHGHWLNSNEAIARLVARSCQKKRRTDDGHQGTREQISLADEQEQWGQRRSVV